MEADQASHGRATDCKEGGGPWYPRCPPRGREVPRRHENSQHAPAPGKELSGVAREAADATRFPATRYPHRAFRFREKHRTARVAGNRVASAASRSEEHTSELQSHLNLVCRLLLEKKNK